MMRQEYEELAGIRVGYLFYSKMIEPMYNSLPEFIDKHDFVESINAREAQAIFYNAIIGQGSIGLLNEDTVITLFADLKYLDIVHRAFPSTFLYSDTDSIKMCFKGGYTHANPIKESEG